MNPVGGRGVKNRIRNVKTVSLVERERERSPLIGLNKTMK